MAQRRILQWFFTIIIFTSGIALSIYTYQGIRKSDEARMLAELQKETYEQSVRASLLFTRAPQILNSFAALFVVSDFVSQQEFKSFSSYLIRNEQEISAIMWAPYVLAEERKKYESRLLHEMGHDHGFIDIKYPERQQIASPLRNFYFPIMYVEPREQRGNYFGIDINGRPINHTLRMMAMNSGLVFTTPVFSELTDPHGASMIAIYHPVHIRNSTSSENSGRFLGFLVMLMTPEVLMRSEFGNESQSRFFMRLIDKDDEYRQIAINRKDTNSAPPQRTFRYNIPMPGRTWILEIYSREHPLYDSIASFLLLCMLTLTCITTLIFKHGVERFTTLNHKNANLELQRRELKLRANFDSLTGLRNRRYFQEKIERLLLQSVREYEIALCLLDLDNFKQMNDQLGHGHGDMLLKAVADVLERETRLGDQVARLGGDEFAIALLVTPGSDAVNAIMDRLLFLIPAIGDEVSGNTVAISASVGISVSSADANDYEILMHQADVAMYASKKRGKNTYTYYNDKLV
jgi:diguanylate cyclase (GGDEF)-like protein